MEHIKSQKNLIRSLKLQKSLFSLAVHQLKTPVLVIHRASKKPENPKMGGIIQRQCESLSAHLRLLLRINELIDPKKNMHKVAVQDIITHCFDAITSKNETHNYVNMCPKMERFYVVAHQELLQEAVLVLLENAMFHTKEGTRVELNIQKTAKSLAFIVKDNGPGFGANTEKDNSFNSGLGLKLCRAITEYHNGDLYIKSNENGTECRIILPL